MQSLLEWVDRIKGSLAAVDVVLLNPNQPHDIPQLQPNLRVDEMSPVTLRAVSYIHKATQHSGDIIYLLENPRTVLNHYFLQLPQATDTSFYCSFLKTELKNVCRVLAAAAPTTNLSLSLLYPEYERDI